MNKPTFGELKYTTFENATGKLPNPDIILRKAGISQDVYLEMLEDPEIWTAFHKRQKSIQRLHYEIEADDKALEKEIKNILENINFTTLTNGLLKAIPLGYSVAEIIWEQKDSKIVPIDIKPRISTKFSFTNAGELLYKTEEYEKIAPYGKFIVHTNNKDDANNPYGTALNSKCYWYWRFKKEGWRAWSLFIDKYGTPPLTLKTDEADPTKLNEMLSNLDNVSSGANMIISTNESIEALSANNGSNLHESYIKEADRQIAKVYLGASLLMDEAKHGNYATSQTMNDSFEDIIMSDATALADTIREHLFKPYIILNYNEVKTLPRIIFYKEDNFTQDIENETSQTDETTQTKSKYDFIAYFSTSYQQKNLPKTKQYLEDMTYLVAKESAKHTLNINTLANEPKTALKELKDKLENSATQEGKFLSYAIFSSKLYAKANLKKPKLLSKFSLKDYDIPILQDYEKAREHFKGKITLTQKEFKELVAQSKNEAFAVASVNNKKQLAIIKQALDDSMNTGEKHFKELVKDTLGADRLKEHHLSTIYRTNLFSSYSRANYEAYTQIQESFPYLMYDAVGDGRTRAAHLALDNKIFKADDEIWDKIYPPNGYNCRCQVIPLTSEKAKELGISNSKDYNSPKFAPDDGWNYHSGKSIKPPSAIKPFNVLENQQTYKDFSLPNILSAYAMSFKDKLITNKTHTMLTDATGANIFIPAGEIRLNLIEDILTNPAEIWLVSTDNFYILNYLKSYKLDKVENYLIQTDHLGNFIELKQIQNPNKYRIGYILRNENEWN